MPGLQREGQGVGIALVQAHAQLRLHRVISAAASIDGPFQEEEERKQGSEQEPQQAARAMQGAFAARQARVHFEHAITWVHGVGAEGSARARDPDVGPRSGKGASYQLKIIDCARGLILSQMAGWG